MTPTKNKQRSKQNPFFGCTASADNVYDTAENFKATRKKSATENRMAGTGSQRSVAAPTLPMHSVPNYEICSRPYIYMQEQHLEKKQRGILTVLLEEKQVEEKIWQILCGCIGVMGRQVLLPPGTAFISDFFESKIRELEGNIQRTHQDLIDSLEKERKLQQEIEEVKSKQSDSSGTGLISPMTMLQNALNDVHKALSLCASNLSEHLRRQNNATRGTQELLPVGVLNSFQHQLCTSFFMGFEMLSFDSDKGPDLPTFEKPKDRKLRLFQEFEEYKTLNVRILHKQQVAFQELIKSRYEQFVSHMRAEPFADAEQRNSFLSSMLRLETDPVYLDFLQLGRATWLLQKLAFAVEPTAEIFRVQSHSNYDPEYMIAEQEQEINARMGAGEKMKVDCMLLPGFTVRNRVFKAHVLLQKSTRSNKHSQTY